MRLEQVCDGVFKAPGARLIDRGGRKRLPIGYEGFEQAMSVGTLVDKTMLIADVLDSGYVATLFCRPRRFGKTLNLTMLRSFFEIPPDGRSRASLFEGTLVWEAEGGRYREYQGAYPVVHLSLNTAKGLTWDETRGAIRQAIVVEYARHGYLAESKELESSDRALYQRIVGGNATDDDFGASLTALCRMLAAHHDHGVVLLIDEYDAPVMAGYTNGYYREAVGFLKRWLTGAIKDGGAALAFACLTGVQRVTKESIFSDLNNLVVDTPLTTRFDERFGFTQEEVEALATYLGHGGARSIQTAREWYDGYRFGNADVYNPWSVLNYLDNGCEPDAYWTNTSSNGVVGDAIAHADQHVLDELLSLLEPGGYVLSPLDLGVVFPDVGVREGALWSMLYLAGYLTTDDVAKPNSSTYARELRIPDREVAEVFRGEVITRFASAAGGDARLRELHRALVAGDEEAMAEQLTRVARDSASFLDLTNENAFHMLVLGLFMGVMGYKIPLSNREAGRGRPDIRLEPDPEEGPRRSPVPGKRPLITIELKYVRIEGDSPADGGGSDTDNVADKLDAAVTSVLAQIAQKGYDEGPLPPTATGRLRWGLALAGGKVAARCERA